MKESLSALTFTKKVMPEELFEIKENGIVVESYMRRASKGLGQVVTDITLGGVFDIEFCSKWFFTNGTMDTIGVYRDVSKLFMTRNEYTGYNPFIRNNPSLHALAIYKGA